MSPPDAERRPSATTAADTNPITTTASHGRIETTAPATGDGVTDREARLANLRYIRRWSDQVCGYDGWTKRYPESCQPVRTTSRCTCCVSMGASDADDDDFALAVLLHRAGSYGNCGCSHEVRRHE